MYRPKQEEGERVELEKEGGVRSSEDEAEWGSSFPTHGAICQEAGSSTPLRYAQNDSAKDGAPSIDETFGTQHWS
jgi:hypothetical protein